MTLLDWLHDSKQRYQTEPIGQATRQSLRALRMGAQRRLADQIGRPIWARGDWDVLVVMDACRTDLLEDATGDYPELPGRVPGVWSNASCSIDWIRRNFNDYPEHAARTGYVTANPFTNHDAEDAQSADLTSGNFAHLDTLYKSHWQDVGGIETVPPEVVTDHAIRAWRRRDDLGMNQLVVHYMQPHEPFRSRPEWGSGDHALLENLVDEDGRAGASVYPRVEAGEISIAEFWQVYLDNLHWLLEDVTDRLLENCEGKVVLSADHGNALGEWGEWQHPPGAISPAVRRVPWVEVEGVDEETVEPDIGGSDPVEATVDDQLEALGYR